MGGYPRELHNLEGLEGLKMTVSLKSSTLPSGPRSYLELSDCVLERLSVVRQLLSVFIFREETTKETLLAHSSHSISNSLQLPDPTAKFQNRRSFDYSIL